MNLTLPEKATVALLDPTSLANAELGRVVPALTWSSVALGGALVAGFLIKQEVLGNKNIEQGERGLRRNRGKIVVNKKTGLPTLLVTGKFNFYFKHLSDIVIQNVRTRTTPEEPTASHTLRVQYKGRVVEIVPVIRWRVEDNVTSIMKSLTALSQVNRADTRDTTLEKYVYNEVRGIIAKHLGEFSADSEGQPIITLNRDEGIVPKGVEEKLEALQQHVGVVIEHVSTPTNAPAPDQVLADSFAGRALDTQAQLEMIIGSRQIARRP